MICPRCQRAQPEGLNFCGDCGQSLAQTVASVATTGQEAVQPDAWIGHTVDSRYRVLDLIGRGGMGAVYRVEHLRMGKIAAMKVMHGALTADRELSARFRREAEAISRLTQVHTVQVFDFGEHQGAMYLIMEYVRGESLGKLLRRDGPMPFARAGNVVAQACESLGEAHEQGVIHRDVKPENLLVAMSRDRTDFVKVLDFGLALVRDTHDIEITQRGSVVGTPYYMSPEQIKGEALDARSDVYSLGAVLYRTLTGENPFTAPSPLGVLTKHMTEALTPPSVKRPEIPAAADEIVLRAMEKRRESRYPSAESMRDDLLRALNVSRNALPRTIEFEDDASLSVGRLSRGDVEAFEKSFRREKRARLAAAGVVLGLLVGAIAWWSMQGQPARLSDREIEPNNEPGAALELGSGSSVWGTIGKRFSREESDRDWYRLHVRGEGPFVLRADVSAVPNMDLKLEVYSSDRNKIAVANTGEVGAGETLPNWGLVAGTYYLLVREVWVAGKAPTENLSDPYKLAAMWRPATSSDEIEPNDQESTAQTLRDETSLLGFLDRADDADYFRFEGESGVWSGEVGPPANLDLVLEVAQPAGKKQTYDRAGPGAPESFTLSRDTPILIVRGKTTSVKPYRIGTRSPPPGH